MGESSGRDLLARMLNDTARLEQRANQARLRSRRARWLVWHRQRLSRPPVTPVTDAAVQITAPPANTAKNATGGANDALFASYVGARDAGASRPMMTLTAAQMTDRIGRNLKRAREAAGLSQREAGEHFHPPMRRNEVGRAENGQARPGEMKLLKFAEIYGVDPGYFYTEHGDQDDLDEEAVG